MWLFYGDETNTDLESGKTFFIYGGIAIEGDNAGPLAAAIAKARSKAGLKPEDKLKFETSAKPKGFDLAKYTDLKKTVIKLGVQHGVKVIAAFVHQKVAKGKSRALRFGINQACESFNAILWRPPKSYGLMLFDRFDKIDAELKDLLASGLSYPTQSARNHLAKIIGFHPSSIGTSHLASLADVVVGSFRFAINTRTHHAATQILQQLQPMCAEGDVVDRERIRLNPRTVTHPPYKAEYDDLRAFLQLGGIDLDKK